MPDLDKVIQEKLFNTFLDDKPYPANEKYQGHLFEQYKLFVEMADRISARRQTASSFFLSVNTALISVIGYLHLESSPQPKDSFFWIVTTAGIALSYLWYRIIRSYRDLNSAKFKVIHEIEKHLPLSPYTAEWEAIGHGKRSDLYLPFTHIEIGIPWIFLLLHGFVLARSILWDVIFCR